MNEQQLRDLFFRTGLPEAYVLAGAVRRQTQAQERREDHAAHHPGDRPPGSQLQRGG
ncbi:MAG: hypothetical protein IJE03_01650 [Ruminiclostridium sp.]|nr:hypothetical protein [Ruminiclostridium sp.]MBQ9852316.1 hypothetical protein [Ruminiclostridium sp.]MBQ9932289.1 hypothetical protein [Ruminiclostridium sp.]